MNTTTLTSHARSALRSAAHSLKPIVLIGDQGLTDSVLKEIDIALKAHELIKIRASGQDREERDAILQQICTALGCEPVHHIGKTLIVYRLGEQAHYVEQTGEKKPAESRKKDAVHIPKKLAAAGVTSLKSRAKKRSGTKTEATTTSKSGVRAFSAERNPRPSTHAARKPRKTAARTIHKSTLSLRAGARRSSK